MREILPMKLLVSLCAVLAVLGAPAAHAQQAEDAEVTITSQMELPADAVWKHAFDAYEGAAGEENAVLLRALAFMNAMAAEGVAPERVKVAVVVHGPAVFDVTGDARYGAKYQGEDGQALRNPNYNNVAELVARGAEIWVCGVAAKHHKVGNMHLLEGVKMAPSATVAHAELQRRGFGLN